MKKIILAIAILCSFGFCECKTMAIDGLLTYVCGDEVSLGLAVKQCGNKFDGQKTYDYYTNNEELTVWRPCEGTLLFKGKIISIDVKNIGVDGYCYDKNGLKETKRVNNITKCK